MGNRDRDCGMEPSVFLARMMMLIAYFVMLLILCGSSGSASFYKGNDGKECLQGNRDLQMDELSTEALGKMQQIGKTSAVFRTDGEPLMNKRFLRAIPKRAGKPDDEDQFMNIGQPSATGYGSRGDILKSLFYLIKYPKRFNRAESKSENYNLRANYIPRLGKKRSYSEQK